MPLTLALGDIACVEADAIVNAANSHLLPGGGVCGAIHAAAGLELARACADWVLEHGAVPTGGAAITPGFALPAHFVIHAVGPSWRGGSAGEPEQLADAYRSAMRLAKEYALHSIAFPSISTGIYGYPVQAAAEVAVPTVFAALNRSDTLCDATFVLFDHETYTTYARVAAAL